MDKTPLIIRKANQLLERRCKSDWVEGILGDLEEAYYANVKRRGKALATVVYLFQTLGFLRPSFKEKSKYSNIEAMFKNYLTATFRNLRKHKFYAAINMFGLAIGMTAGFMILQYVYFEFSYDTFFENKENIYRVQTNRYNNGELTTQWAAGAAGVGLHMKEDFPEVKDFVIMHESKAAISYEKDYFELKRPYYASSNFFKMFSIPLIRGVDSLVLSDPWTVVLTESLAKKYLEMKIQLVNALYKMMPLTSRLLAFLKTCLSAHIWILIYCTPLTLTCFFQVLMPGLIGNGMDF